MYRSSKILIVLLSIVLSCVLVACRSYNNGLIFYDLETNASYLPPTVSVSRGRNLASFKYSDKGSIWSTFGKPCDCNGIICSCCAGIKVKQYKFDQKMCANVTYMAAREEALLEVYLNEQPSSKYGISARNPAPFCIPVMMGIPMAMCVQMSDIAVKGNNLNMCMDFVVRLATSDLFEMHFQCMRMGLDGIQYVDKNGNPVLPPGSKKKHGINNASSEEEYLDENDAEASDNEVNIDDENENDNIVKNDENNIENNDELELLELSEQQQQQLQLQKQQQQLEQHQKDIVNIVMTTMETENNEPQTEFLYAVPRPTKTPTTITSSSIATSAINDAYNVFESPVTLMPPPAAAASTSTSTTAATINEIEKQTKITVNNSSAINAGNQSNYSENIETSDIDEDNSEDTIESDNVANKSENDNNNNNNNNDDVDVDVESIESAESESDSEGNADYAGSAVATATATATATIADVDISDSNATKSETGMPSAVAYHDMAANYGVGSSDDIRPAAANVTEENYSSGMEASASDESIEIPEFNSESEPEALSSMMETASVEEFSVPLPQSDGQFDAATATVSTATSPRAESASYYRHAYG